MKKIISLILILALSASILISCSGTSYKDDVSLDAVRAEIEKNVSADGGYQKLSDDYLKFYFELPEGVKESAVIQSTKSEDITEFGIFKVDTKDADAVKHAVEKYLAAQKEILVPQVNMYAPEEAPKIENASVRVFGGYVVYLVMEKDTQSTVYSAVEALLKK